MRLNDSTVIRMRWTMMIADKMQLVIYNTMIIVDTYVLNVSLYCFVRTKLYPFVRRRRVELEHSELYKRFGSR